ncbi:MAG TPA: hypothetical protein EYO33_22185 [Phycisphaerales bacterium]|nr:hypothetical protein [Phycisphaerales bacterium]
MRLAGAGTIDQANEVLWDFLPRFNQRFAVAPAQPGSAYRQLPAGMSLDAILCFKYLRTVANDNTVQFNGTTLQLLADDYRASYARANVEVQERLDGSLVVVHQGKTLALEPAPPIPVTLRARKGRRSNGHIPANGAYAHHVPAERWPGALQVHKIEHHPPTTAKTRPPRKPAPDHPWRRKLLT